MRTLGYIIRITTKVSRVLSAECPPAKHIGCTRTQYLSEVTNHAQGFKVHMSAGLVPGLTEKKNMDRVGHMFIVRRYVLGAMPRDFRSTICNLNGCQINDRLGWSQTSFPIQYSLGPLVCDQLFSNRDLAARMELPSSAPKSLTTPCGDIVTIKVHYKVEEIEVCPRPTRQVLLSLCINANRWGVVLLSLPCYPIRGINW